MTVGTFEAQKVRIQNTIELQLDKARAGPALAGWSDG